MTFIGREISFQPFFSLPFFPRFYLVGVVKRGLLGCVHNMCLSPRVPEPRGHASGPSTHDICHRLHHVTSIFCKQVSLARTDISSSPLSFPRVSVTAVLDVCQPASCQPSPHLSSSLFYWAKTQAALRGGVRHQHSLGIEL